MLSIIHSIICFSSFYFCQLRARVENLLTSYLAAHRPGDAIPKEMQLLKGCMRETEVDRVWALSNMPMNRIHHMRSKFYTDDFFCPMPSLEGTHLFLDLVCFFAFSHDIVC